MGVSDTDGLIDGISVQMSVPADDLWWLNNEYRKRLSRAERTLGLLEQIVVARTGLDSEQLITIMEALEAARRQILILAEDHRNWRYTFYYQSALRKRMVQSEVDIHRALVHFQRMRARHERILRDLADVIAQMPQPDPQVTLVSTGDLWSLTQYAFAELFNFVDRPNGMSAGG